MDLQEVEDEDNHELDMLQDDEGEVMNDATIETEENETVESEGTEPRENKEEKASIERKNSKPKISKNKKEDQGEIDRKWRKREVETELPEYNAETGPVPEVEDEDNHELDMLQDDGGEVMNDATIENEENETVESEETVPKGK
ncbi:hypothetical protein JTB14_017210 [Gonioctena quinquepunctata]|nr:hypothetical protein JTB14_017210 [Gonioctena quinquepunctata]